MGRNGRLGLAINSEHKNRPDVITFSAYIEQWNISKTLKMIVPQIIFNCSDQAEPESRDAKKLRTEWLGWRQIFWAGKPASRQIQKHVGVGDVCFFLTMRCFNDAMFSNS